ncbi:MAG: hypothetical protein RLZZ246_1977 [Planctomycetota bacterium]
MASTTPTVAATLREGLAPATPVASARRACSPS